MYTEKNKNRLDKKRVVDSVEALTVQNIISEVCSSKGFLGCRSSWSSVSINDLVAEEEVYHKDCYHTFVKSISFPSSKAEIPRDKHVIQATDESFAYKI